MKWVGLVSMVVGLIGGFALHQVPLSVQWTEVGGPHADFSTTEVSFSAAVPMFFLFIAGLIIFLMSRRQSTDERPRT